MQHPLDAAYLTLPRQEDQQTSGLLAQHLAHGPCRLLFQAPSRIATEIDCLDRKLSPLAFNDGSIAQEAGHPRAVQGRRHDQKPQIIAQQQLGIARQG